MLFNVNHQMENFKIIEFLLIYDIEQTIFYVDPTFYRKWVCKVTFSAQHIRKPVWFPCGIYTGSFCLLSNVIGK